MKKRAKRLTALLLSLAMALSMLSATAWATNGSDTGTGAASAATSTTGTGDSAATSDSSSAVVGSMGILDALDDTTLSAIVAVAEAEAAAAANANDGIATISDDEDEETDIMLAEAAEEASNITVIDEDGNSSALTDEQLNTILYYYGLYLDDYNEHVAYLGRQTPWFTQYEEDSDDGLGPLGSMLVLAGTTVDAVRSGDYTYDELLGTIWTFYYGDYYGVEYYGDDILAAKNDALQAVKDSGATTDAQKLLVLTDWLADNASFDMAYIMNMSSDDDLMVAADPQQSEHYGDLFEVFYNLYYDSMVSAYGANYGPTYAQYAAAQMVTAVEGMWNGCLIGTLALGKGVCMAYTSAFAYLVQWMYPEVYSVNGTLTTAASSWKTVEELNYVKDEDGNLVISTDADYMVDFVMIVYNSSVSMYGESNDDFSSQHFWNAVKIDGEWYYIDTCYIDIYTECMIRDRVEINGDVNHVYFLMSDTSAREMYDGYFSGLYTLYEGVATDESYQENSWMYYAASNVYSDGNSKFYYAFDSTDLFTMVDKYGNGSDSSSDLDYNDYSDLMDDDTEYKIVYHTITDDDRDTATDFVTLVDITGGQVYNPTTGAMEDSELIAELYEQHEAYEELYPSLSLTMALYGDTIYFNIANCVLSYDITTGEVVKVKEYNDVYANRDDTEAFGGMAFTVTYDEENYDVYESNPPIAGLAIIDGTLYVDVASNYAYISGKSSVDDLTSYGWEFQESNYNSSYNMWTASASDSYGGMASSYMDTDNDNDEFMWSAVFTDTIAMSTVTSSSLEYEEVYVEATCGRDAFTENRTTEGLIENGSRVYDEGTACEHHFVEFNETYYTKDDNGNWNTATNYVCTICGLSVTDEDDDEDEVEVTYEQAAELAGHTYVATEDGITWTENEDGTYSATVTDLICSVCGDMKTSNVIKVDEDGNNYETTVYSWDCLVDDDTIEVTLDEELTCDVTSAVSGECSEGLTTTYYAVGPEGSDYEGMILGSMEVQGEAGTHDYVVEDDDWTWTENEDGTYSAVATVMTCSVCGDTQENVEAVVTSETTAATCTEAGYIVYTAVATIYDDDGNAIGSASTTKTVETDAATGHSYEYAWTWAEDYSTASVTRTCSACGDTETVDAEVTYETTDADCTTAGTVTYTATATFSDESEASDVQTVEVTALGHDWAEPEWSWSEDYATATATFTCNRCSETETVEATVTSATTDPTCTETGETVYTATAELDGETYTDSKTVTLDALGHDWADTVWGEWTETESSGYTITATRTCSVCGEVETAIVDVTATSADADCTTPGTVTYTAVATFSDGTTENAPDSKVVEGVAMGHSYEDSWAWGDDYTTATMTLTCSRCGDVQTVTTTDIVENEDFTYTATATYDGIVYTDTITPYGTGLYAMSDGTTRYYEDGVFQSDFEGFVKEDGLWYRVENGLLNLEFTGLGYQSTNGYYYYAEDGIVDFTFNGFLKKANGEDNYWWYVKNGMYRPTFTGLALQTDGYYYYAEDGKVNFNWTGFAKKSDETDTYWWYVKNGMYRPTYTGLGLQTDGYYYYAVDGKVDFTFNGFVKLDGLWYYIKNGMSRPTFTGLALQTDGNYYYAVDGIVDFSFTGFVKMDGDWWYVLRGRMRPDFTGLALQTDGNYYYAVDGKVDFDFNGFVKMDGLWYYVKRGRVRLDFTGLAKQTDGNYYYAEDGIVNFDFTGIVEHTNGKSYYVRNGMVRFNYTGTVTYNGKTYNVVKGVVS